MAGLRRPLRQRTEAYRVCFLRQRLPRGGPFERIPRDWLGDLKCRLALGIHFDLYNSRAISWIELYRGSAQTEMLEAVFGLFPKIIVADSAGDDALIAQEIRHVCEIRGCAAKLATLRKNIPEQFAQSDRRELFHGRPAFPWQYGAFAQRSMASYFVSANAFRSQVLMPDRAQFPNRERKHFALPLLRIQLNSVTAG